MRRLDGIIDMSLCLCRWRTGKPGVLQSIGLQRAGHDWATELLFGAQDFLSSGQKTDSELNTKLSQLSDLLLQTCPFGTLLDANLHNSLDSINFASVTHLQKQPAWRTGTYKGKPQVSISITEKVNSMQYDKQEIADTWQVVGVVTCKVRFSLILVLSYHLIFMEKSKFCWLILHHNVTFLILSINSSHSILYSSEIF